MKNHTRIIATLSLLFILPAALFMAALEVRHMQSLPFGAADFAQRIVMSYAGRVWTLWVLLIAMPLAAFISGCATLFASWARDLELRNIVRQSIAAIRAHPARLFVAATTLMAAGILTIVALHLMAN
jgi:hypothetical protein